MSEGGVNPDVVVVGMPSCGKTVFFTVLGKKFTNLVDGRRSAPLGFRMSTCDQSTSDVVDAAYDRLRAGSWPETTKEGQIMPLRWDVLTGKRRVFKLYSMDIAGETFKRTFGIGDRKNTSAGGRKTRPKEDMASKSGVAADEIYNRGQDPGSETEAGSELERAATELNRAIATAKVVCFMVNVALPDIFRGKKLNEDDETKLTRFRNSTVNIFHTLKEQPELCRKSVILLTQTHRHEGEIERAGGAVMYLADICGHVAAELSNFAKENRIPVIPVSAINEERDSNELPTIFAPEDIPSSGLFGFLLTMSGMAAPNDNLAIVKDAYLAYQRERVGYLKHPAREVKFRLRQAGRRKAAAEAFVEQCKGYLDDVANLTERGGAALPDEGTRETYWQSTREDPEVVSAMDDTVYWSRDILWDRVLRKAAVSERFGKASTPNEIYEEVKTGIGNAYPEKRGISEEFVYGFGEDDLPSVGQASSLYGWISQNQNTYRQDLAAGIKELQDFKNGALIEINKLNEAVDGADGFDRCYEYARKACTAFYEKISAFRKDWLGNGTTSLHEVERMENDVNEKSKYIAQCKKRHDEAVEKAEEERRKKEFEDSVSEMRKVLGEIRRTADSLHSHEGLDTFSSRRKDVESKLSSVAKQFESSKNKWQKSYRLDVPDLIKIEDEIKAIWSEIEKSAKNHVEALVAAENQRIAQVEARRRRKWTISTIAFVGFVLLLFIISNSYCSYWNDKYAQVVKAQFERGDFSQARKVYESMYEIPALLVSKSRHFASGFAEWLDSAAKLDEKKMELEALASGLRKLFSSSDFEAIKPHIPVAALEAANKSLRMYVACTSQIASVTFDSTRRGEVSFDEVLNAVSRCEDSLVGACADLDKKIQQVRAIRTVEECERLLDEAEACLLKDGPCEVEKLLKEVQGKVDACKLPQVCDEATRRRQDKINGRLSRLKADFTAKRIEVHVKEMDEHYAAKRWLDCIVVANKILALDACDKKAMAVKTDAQKEIDAKGRAETADGEVCRFRIEAMSKGAEIHAAGEWNKAEALYKSARDAFEAHNYIKAHGLFENARICYKSAESAAEKKSKPRIRLVAKLNGVEKRASVTSGVNGFGWVTPVDSIESETGNRITFGAELTENGVKYVGETVHVARNGEQTVTVELKPEFTLPAHVRFCGNCGRSLASHRHERRCPYCNSYPDK